MKKFKKIIPALCMLLVSAVLLGSSTYAWFSLNNKVTVTGMQVSTKVDNNLLIAATEAGNTKVADSEFKNALNSTAEGKLQPVSTVNGTDFFYTYDAKADGSAIKTKYTKVGEDKKINTNYVAYVDQVFELKAINTGSQTNLKLTTLNLLYNGAAVTVEKAYRVALFCQKVTTTNEDNTSTSAVNDYYGTASVTRIFSISGATYFDNTAVSAVDSKSAINADIFNKQFSELVKANSTAYFKITVRMWLEGEDTTCNNTTFMDLTGKWTLDLTFTLDKDSEPSTAVSNIGTEANATLTKAEGSNTLTAELKKTGETADSYAWYKVGETAAISGQTTATYTPTTSPAGTYYCEITTVKGNVYRTPNVKVD